jgi:hypothetical protein
MSTSPNISVEHKDLRREVATLSMLEGRYVSESQTEVANEECTEDISVLSPRTIENSANLHENLLATPIDY